jgi:VanZ family protein
MTSADKPLKGSTRSHLFLTVTLPLYAWFCLMMTVSSVPGTKLPHIGLWNWDKLAHTFEYAVLAFLLFRRLRRKEQWLLQKAFWFTLIACSLWGAVDEVHQLFIPNRACTWQDWVADTVGVVGVCMVLKFWEGKRTQA